MEGREESTQRDVLPVALRFEEAKGSARLEDDAPVGDNPSYAEALLANEGKEKSFAQASL